MLMTGLLSDLFIVSSEPHNVIINNIRLELCELEDAMNFAKGKVFASDVRGSSQAVNFVSHKIETIDINRERKRGTNRQKESNLKND